MQMILKFDPSLPEKVMMLLKDSKGTAFLEEMGGLVK